jgi:hypothetical protein
MKQYVIVVTGLELGWDNVVGVFSGVSLEELQTKFSEERYVHTYMEIETSLDERD